MFTYLTKNNITKFIPSGEPNRSLLTAGGEDDNFNEWNDIDSQMINLVQLLKLPKAGKKKVGEKEDYKFHYSILKTDPNVKLYQQEHTDELEPF